MPRKSHRNLTIRRICSHKSSPAGDNEEKGGGYKIEKQEQLIAQLDEKIEAAAADYQELTRLLGEKEEAENILMELMEAWEEAQT